MTVTQPEWVQRLFRAVRPLLPKDFVGRIEINCRKGDIGRDTVRTPAAILQLEEAGDPRLPH